MTNKTNQKLLTPLFAKLTGKPRYWLLASVTSLFLLSSSVSFAAVLAGWDVHALAGGTNSFGVSPLVASSSDTNLTVGGLTRGVGVLTTGTAAARAWGGNDWLATSAAAAVSANDIVTFTLSAKPGYQVSLSSISRLDYRRSSSGPSSGVLQYQLGTGAFNDITTLGYSSTASTGASIAAINLSGIASLQNIPAGTTVTFRLVNYAGTNTGGTWYIYDVANTTASDLEVSGTVSATTASQDGVCGSANGQAVLTAPTSNLCSVGNPSTVTGSGPWTWTCSGTNGGNTANCSATSSDTGVCL
jgi:hypothetical protein